MSLSVRQITPNDVALMEALLATFGDAFGDVDTYSGNRPKLGTREDVLHFDIAIDGGDGTARSRRIPPASGFTT